MAMGDELMRRILRWVVAVMRFIGDVSRTTANVSFIRQLADSAGSTGANFVEARSARSRKEFISSTGISRKECKESLFWLTVLKEINSVLAPRIDELIKEGNEIASILTTIGKNAKMIKLL